MIPIPIHGIGGTLRTRAILVFQNVMRARKCHAIECACKRVLPLCRNPRISSLKTLEHQVRALPAMNTTLLSKASEWSDEKTMLSSNTSSPQSSPAASRVCTICGDRAGHHLHYGAVACFSCRQFFRRGRSLAVQCITGLGFCSVNKNNRTNCKYCRSVCSILYGSDIIGQMSIGQMGCNRLKSS